MNLDEISNRQIEKFLNEIKLKRKSLGISQSQLAKKMGISVSSYCKFENNQLRVTFDLVLKSALLLDLNFECINDSKVIENNITKDYSEIYAKINSVLLSIESQKKELDQIKTILNLKKT